MNIYKILIITSISLIGLSANAKCVDYGYQVLCDNVKEYNSAPAPSASKQDPYGGKNRQKGSNWLNPKNDPDIQECLNLNYGESMVCLGELKRRREQSRY